MTSSSSRWAISWAFGTVVDYVDSYDDEWAIIMFEGKQAYVSRQYLASEEAPAETSAGMPKPRPERLGYRPGRGRKGRVPDSSERETLSLIHI